MMLNSVCHCMACSTQFLKERNSVKCFCHVGAPIFCVTFASQLPYSVATEAAYKVENFLPCLVAPLDRSQIVPGHVAAFGIMASAFGVHGIAALDHNGGARKLGFRRKVQ